MVVASASSPQPDLVLGTGSSSPRSAAGRAAIPNRLRSSSVIGPGRPPSSVRPAAGCRGRPSRAIGGRGDPGQDLGHGRRTGRPRVGSDPTARSGHGRPSVGVIGHPGIVGQTLPWRNRRPFADRGPPAARDSVAHGRRRRHRIRSQRGASNRPGWPSRSGTTGMWSAEISHDPFLPLALAAEHTERIELGHGHRRGLRPQPDDPGHGGQRPPDPVRGPVHARARIPDQAPHREAVLHAVVPSRPADAGADHGHPGHLGQLVGRQPAGLPGRVLPTHPDDPDVRPRAQSRTATHGSSSPPWARG